DYVDGKWQNCEITELKNLSVHPGNLAWHYGQSIFEGMKASITNDGVPLLLRPEKHIERLNNSARRMCMPEFPEETFIEAIEKLVFLDKAWIPAKKGSALYLRPIMMAMDSALGVRPSDTYKLMIFTLPVGPYYNAPVSLLAQDEYVRAADGGVGEAKTAGNYAASLFPARLAKEKGYDQVMWMDAKEFKYIQEVGTMNIFFVIDGKVVTPKAGGTILRGITRDSVITILKDEGYEVEERLLDIAEIIQAHTEGKLQEVFGTGTAAVISNVFKFAHKGIDYDIDVDGFKISPFLKKYIEDLRAGERKDKFGWLTELRESVLA
ncbi:branched-chain amino acid aminotransferase, partial [Saprospiraceae bacterium]|nr:branched-chain amino acid aminotransferase [Saprospiraceae bacterium]